MFTVSPLIKPIKPVVIKMDRITSKSKIQTFINESNLDAQWAVLRKWNPHGTKFLETLQLGIVANFGYSASQGNTLTS